MVRSYPCPYCPAVFSRGSVRTRHIHQNHAGVPQAYRCLICGFDSITIAEYHNHIVTHEPQNDFLGAHDEERKVSVYRKNYLPPTASLELTLGSDHPKLYDILSYEAGRKRYAKCNLVVLAEYVTIDRDGIITRSLSFYHKPSTFSIMMYADFDQLINKCHAEVLVSSEDFVTKGSSWVLYAIRRVDLRVAACRPLRGGCGNQVSVTYANDIFKFTQVSMKDDKRCFYRSIAAAFVFTDNLSVLDDFVTKNLKTENFVTPFRVHDILAFEKLHADTLNFKINVIYKENTDFYPIYVSNREGVAQVTINLLLYHQYVGPEVEDNCKNDGVVDLWKWEEIDDNGRAVPAWFAEPNEKQKHGSVEMHYAYICDLDKFARKIYGGKTFSAEEIDYYDVDDDNLSSRKKCRSYKKIFFCPNCLNSFASEERRNDHIKLCLENKAQRIVTPKVGECLEFKNFVHKFDIPLIGFYDFEAVQVAPEKRCSSICDDPSTCYHKSFIESEQKAGTYSLVIMNLENKIIHSNTYSGDDCAEQFIKHLLDIEPALEDILNANQPMRLTPYEELCFRQAKNCHICMKRLCKNDDHGRDAVRDHCHITGKYMGAAHNYCNMKRKVLKKVVLYAHNFSNYDSHMVLGSMPDDDRIWDLECLPRNQEKIRTLTMNKKYCFYDSMSFLDGSLSAIVDDLVRSGNEDFQLLEDAGLCKNMEQRQLLLRKGRAYFLHTTFLFS